MVDSTDIKSGEVFRDDLQEKQRRFMADLKPAAMVKKLSGGENSEAFLCDDLIVRFPKSDKATGDYKKEAALSSVIRKSSSYLESYVPDVHMEERCGLIAAVHHEIKGKTLMGRRPNDDRNIHFDSLSNDAQKELAVDLGKFLSALHTVPMEDIDEAFLASRQMGFQYSETPDFYEKNKKLYAERGFPYEKYKCEVDRTDTVLCHNDFHGGNFAVNEQGRLSGVFDLGEMGKNYRARDFLSLYSFGRKFVRDVVASYNESSDKKVSMQELDFHYLNKMAEFPRYAEQYNRPDLLPYFDKNLAAFCDDVKAEERENDFNRVRGLVRQRKNCTENYVNPKNFNFNFGLYKQILDKER